MIRLTRKHRPHSGLVHNGFYDPLTLPGRWKSGVGLYINIVLVPLEGRQIRLCFYFKKKLRLSRGWVSLHDCGRGLRQMTRLNMLQKISYELSMSYNHTGHTTAVCATRRVDYTYRFKLLLDLLRPAHGVTAEGAPAPPPAPTLAGPAARTLRSPPSRPPPNAASPCSGRLSA